MARKMHLEPTACYICGGPEHKPTSHNYWSNTVAEAEFSAAPQGDLPERPEGYYHSPLAEA